ncbi:FkbM family methyltransferase [Flavobacterium sp. ACAM 123]|uniref:FkbM family methyltransferase n=1 Tax=Flavobacterium sp. ACAM 123 TaxID=1189620 RepID=UPI000307FE1A|nr:FkbM family methyltransferase [Flavobacterium sp. ACAM 123]
MKIFLKKIVTNLGYKISKISKCSLQNENPLVAIKKSIRDAKDIVLFDVGANLGQTVTKMRLEFPFSKIYAFEPSRSCYEILKNNFDKKNVFVYNNAVGSENGKVTFNEYSWSALSSILKRAFGSAQIIDTYDVNVISIDSFCKVNNVSKIDFLKTDTEGYELEVLKGASDMMDKNKIQFVYLEIFFKENFIGQSSFGDTYNFLLGKRFELVKIYDFEIAEDGLLNRSDALFINKNF